MQALDFIATLSVLIFSVVAHEVSHGYMAQYLGDPTARLAGRLTANPLKHLDPMGSVLVPLSLYLLTSGGMTIGWAKPVPYNRYNLRDQVWGDAKVAVAGPLTNIGIALLFGLLLRFAGEYFSGPAQTILHYIVLINIVLAVFNLVPIPPLDGSKMLESLLPFRYRYIIEYLERYAFLFVLIFVFFLWKYFFPLINVLYALIVGLPF